MAERSIEIELHPDTVTKIRETLVGTVAHVNLLGQTGQHKGDHGGLKLLCFSPKQPKSAGDRQGEPDAFLLLTADSVEVSGWQSPLMLIPISRTCTQSGCMKLTRTHGMPGVHGLGGGAGRAAPSGRAARAAAAALCSS